MAIVNDCIVKEFFEALGYLVSQPCKHVVSGRSRRPDEEVDLIVWHPLIAEQKVPKHIIWTAEDLKSIACAVVGVYGWHADRFYPTMIEHFPEISRFAGEEAVRIAGRRIDAKDPAKILCLPRLPASAKLQDDILQMLRQKGIDGVFTFRTLLLELIGRVDKSRNYEKSDLLQTIRILKTYDLLADSQMELFLNRRGRSRRKTAKPANSESQATGDPKVG